MKIFFKNVFVKLAVTCLLLIPINFGVNPGITHASVGCVGELSLKQELPDGTERFHSTNGVSIAVSPDEAYYIEYKIHSQYSSAACFGRFYYTVFGFLPSGPTEDYSKSGAYTEGQVVTGSEHLDNLEIGTHRFILSITNQSGFDPDAYRTEMDVNFVKGSTSGDTGSDTGTPTSATDVYPKNGAACTIDATTVKIFWTTAKAAYSGLDFHQQGNLTNITYKSGSSKLTSHSFALTGLKAATDYTYRVYSLKSAIVNGTKFTDSDVLAGSDFSYFKTGDTNGDLCTTYLAGKTPDANSNSNSGPPNNSLPNNAINTGITANFGSLDANLGSFFNPIKAGSVPELITTIIRILFLLISIAAIITIIVAGFRMVLSSGNETELTNAKKAITWAIVGLIVSLMSFSIVAIIQALIKK